MMAGIQITGLRTPMVTEQKLKASTIQRNLPNDLEVKNQVTIKV
jgi:hypothetical protein